MIFFIPIPSPPSAPKRPNKTAIWAAIFLLFSFLAIMPHNKIGKPKKDGIMAVRDLLPVEIYRITPSPISNIPTIRESLVMEVILF